MQSGNAVMMAKEAINAYINGIVSFTIAEKGARVIFVTMKSNNP